MLFLTFDVLFWTFDILIFDVLTHSHLFIKQLLLLTISILQLDVFLNLSNLQHSVSFISLINTNRFLNIVQTVLFSITCTRTEKSSRSILGKNTSLEIQHMPQISSRIHSKSKSNNSNREHILIFYLLGVIRKVNINISLKSKVHNFDCQKCEVWWPRVRQDLRN